MKVRMTNRTAGTGFLAALCALAILLIGRTTSASPATLLNEAIYAEETAGDLDQAIRLYDALLGDAQKDRIFAAAATYRLGQCYIKKGDRPKAQDAFRTVLRDYPDQTVWGERASRELRRLEVAGTPMLANAANADEGRILFSGTYRHAWGQEDVRFERREEKDGAIRYQIENLNQSTYTLVTDAEGRPFQYLYSHGGKPAGGYAFGSDRVNWIRQADSDGPITNTYLSITSGALPDFNSRPDPYLAQNLLVRAYDYEKSGQQDFMVYDVDDAGQGFVEYIVSLELADESGVQLTNGFFKARHLVQRQETPSRAWFKKRQGSRTDYWVDFEGNILRILREREPYEVALIDYAPPEKRNRSLPLSADTKPEHPSVTATFPECLANAVSPTVSAIRITFSQPMREKSASINFIGPLPKPTGAEFFDNTRTTWTLPVELKAGQVYWIGLNTDGAQFRNDMGWSARPHVLLFATADEQGNPTSIPEKKRTDADAINTNLVLYAPESGPIKLLTGRYGHASATDGRKIYVIGGSSGRGRIGDIEAVDPKTGLSEVIATNLIPRRYHTAAFYNDRLYILGGESFTDLAKEIKPGAADSGVTTNAMVAVIRKYTLEPTVEIYDLKTGALTTAPGLPTPRRMVRSAIIQDKLYVVGGSTVIELEPAATMLEAEELSYEERRALRLAAREGGVDQPQGFSQIYTGLVEVLDLKFNTWTSAPPMPTPRECAVVAAQEKLYAIGGYDGGALGLRAVEVFDPTLNRWEKRKDIPPMIGPLSAHSAVALGDRIATFGDYRYLDRVLCYHLDSDSWTVPMTGFQPGRHTAAVVLGGSVYVSGGNVDRSRSCLESVQVIPAKDLMK